jgi:hypothetical protein
MTKRNLSDRLQDPKDDSFIASPKFRDASHTIPRTVESSIDSLSRKSHLACNSTDTSLCTQGSQPKHCRSALTSERVRPVPSRARGAEVVSGANPFERGSPTSNFSALESQEAASRFQPLFNITHTQVARTDKIGPLALETCYQTRPKSATMRRSRSECGFIRLNSFS